MVLIALYYVAIAVTGALFVTGLALAIVGLVRFVRYIFDRKTSEQYKQWRGKK